VERGVVLSADADNHTYRVRTASGRIQYMTRLRSHPGDLALYPVHTQVLVSHALGTPLILGIIPDAGRTPSTSEPENLTGTSGHGGEDPLLARNVAPSARNANEPRDQVPGDAVQRSPDGASISALRGRIAQLRGSDLAKIEAFGTSDLVRVVAGVFEMISWMGESRIVNNEGKTSFIWQGGSDQLTQTGQDESQYTIHLNVGHIGNVLRLQITNREGQPKFEAHVDPDGRINLFSRKSVEAHYGSSNDDEHRTTFIGNNVQEVIGNRVCRVEGDANDAVEGNHTLTVDANKSEYVTGESFCQITLGKREAVGGNAESTVTGSCAVYAQNGISHEVMGSGVYDVKTTGGAVSVATRGGLCSFQTGRGNFEVTSSLIKLMAGADSVLLGQNPVSHATKFEELAAALGVLTQAVSALFALVATHVHPLVGPAPGSTGPAPTLAPLATPVPIDISAAKSVSTKLT